MAEPVSGLGAALSIAGGLLDYGLQQSSIDKQNDYNSPVSQVRRLNEAGLNPNLIYGSIQPSTQSNIPSSKIDPSSIFQNVLAEKTFQMNKDVADSQIRVNEANALNINQDTENKKAQNPIYLETSRQMKLANDMQEVFNEYKRQHPDSTYIPELERFSNELSHIKRIDDLAEKKLALDTLLNDATTKKLEAETKHIGKQTDYVDKQIEFLETDIEHYVDRYLSSPTPWYAGLILTALARFAHLTGDTPTEIINNIVDKVVTDTDSTKSEIKSKLTNIYSSKYVKHDNQFTYRVITSGPYKGKYVKIRQSDGNSEIVDFIP